MNIWSISKITGGFIGYKWTYNWISKVISPAGNCNPFIYALGFDIGALNNPFDWLEATNTLGSFTVSDGFMWQWKPINEQEYLHNVNNDHKIHSAIAFVAQKLLEHANRKYG
jgi:hypothetical protein